MEKDKAYKGKDGYLYTADGKNYIDPVSGEKTKVSGSEGKKDPHIAEYTPDEKELEGLTEEGSNEELLNSVTIVTPPQIEEDFRFFTVAKVFAFAADDLYIKEGKRPDARNTGILYKGGLCYVLEDRDDGWYYVESGKVRGFIPKDSDLTKKSDPEKFDTSLYKAVLKQKSGSVAELYAKEEIPYYENNAFAYLRYTTGVTIAGTRCSLAAQDNTAVYEETSEDSRVIGTLPAEGRCYIIKSAGDGWQFVESGDVRGFVKKESLRMYDDPATAAYISEKGEGSFPLAAQNIEPAENKALYYSLASVKPASKAGHIREAMIEFASQFLGHPYVWGGTSLTNGCDCSGFCQQIYAAFGYSLPRVSRDQAYVGTKIPVTEALPGDLIFYARNGQIFHVAMSTGNGGTIEAMNSQNGIVNSTVAADYAVWAARIIEDDADTITYTDDATTIDKSMTGKYLGRFKVMTCSPNRDSGAAYRGADEAGQIIRQGNIAVTDPDVIPYGTRFIINGCEYVSADCGLKVSGNRILIFTNNALEKEAVETYRASVYEVKQ